MNPSAVQLAHSPLLGSVLICRWCYPHYGTEKLIAGNAMGPRRYLDADRVKPAKYSTALSIPILIYTDKYCLCSHPSPETLHFTTAPIEESHMYSTRRDQLTVEFLSPCVQLQSNSWTLDYCGGKMEQDSNSQGSKVSAVRLSLPDMTGMRWPWSLSNMAP